MQKFRLFSGRMVMRFQAVMALALTVAASIILPAMAAPKTQLKEPKTPPDHHASNKSLQWQPDVHLIMPDGDDREFLQEALRESNTKVIRTIGESDMVIYVVDTTKPCRH